MKPYTYVVAGKYAEPAAFRDFVLDSLRSTAEAPYDIIEIRQVLDEVSIRRGDKAESIKIQILIREVLNLNPDLLVSAERVDVEDEGDILTFETTPDAVTVHYFRAEPQGGDQNDR